MTGMAKGAHVDRAKLQERVTKLLKAFEDDTGLLIYDIQIERANRNIGEVCGEIIQTYIGVKL